MILSRAPPGLLNNKTIASSRCSSSVSGRTSAAGDVGQAHGAVPFSRRFSLNSCVSTSFCIVAARASVGALVEELSVANDENELRQTRSVISKRVTLGRPELAEVIAALLRGEDVERTIAPWVGIFAPEDWNKVVAQTGDIDWKLALCIFNFLITSNVLAVQPNPLCDEADEEKKLKLLKAFTAIATILTKNGREAEVEILLLEMRCQGVDPDAHLFNTLIRGYGSKGLVHLASQVLIRMDVYGVKPNNATYERIIAAYLFGEQPQVEKAMQILQGARASNFMVAYRTLSDLLTACWMANKVEDADLVFQDMISANYNIEGKVWVKLMHLHAKGGHFEVVESLFQQMREAGVEVKSGAFDGLLLSYCRAGKTDQALSVFREYKLTMKPSLVAFNMIIDATGKAGRHDEAVQLYVDLIQNRYRPNIVTYTSLISAVVQAGRYEKADELYRRMLNDRLEPNCHTYCTMIHACAMRGWTKYGHEICLAASKGTITNALYGAMLHLYTKNRWFSHAAAVLEEMGRQGVEPDVAAIGTLISACGEQDDAAFAPLAKAMEGSQFEPCQVAFRLVFVPSANNALRQELSPPQTGDTTYLEADSVVEEASSFFTYYASAKDFVSNASFYNALIDALWARHLRLRAKLVFLRARELLEDYPRPQYNEEAWSLDLRTLSKGASQVALLHWLEEVAERATECPVVAARLVLVTGGKEGSSTLLRPYSGRGKGAMVVKQTVEETVDALGIPFIQSSKEFAQLQAETEQVIRWVSMYKDRLQWSNTRPS